MAFNIGNSPDTGKAPTKAARLHARYNLLTHGASQIAHWRTMLTRGATHDELDCLINYLESQTHLPGTQRILSHLDHYLAEAAKDPVAQRYGYTKWASELAEKLDREGNPVAPEILQHTRDTYAEYLAAMASVALAVWVQMPPPAMFVEQWYGEIARYGSVRMRVFYPAHPKFRPWVLAYCRAAGIFGTGLLEDERLK